MNAILKKICIIILILIMVTILIGFPLATLINYSKNPEWVNTLGIFGLLGDAFIIISTITG